MSELRKQIAEIARLREQAEVGVWASEGGAVHRFADGEGEGFVCHRSYELYDALANDPRDRATLDFIAACGNLDWKALLAAL